MALDADTVAAAGLTVQFVPLFGLLTLQGDASVAQYQTVLRTLTYVNTADVFAADQREIGFQLTDNAIQVGDNTSDQASAFVALTEQNDAPTLATIENQEVDFGQAIQFQTNAGDLDREALTFAVSVAGLSTAEEQPAISETGVFTWSPTEAGEFDVTVTATDSSNAAVEQTFTVEVGSLLSLIHI